MTLKGMRDNGFCKELYIEKLILVYFFSKIHSLCFLKGQSQEIVLRSDISAFLCVLMFCFKGKMSQDFLLQIFFHESSSPKPLKIRKFVDFFTFVDLPHVWQFADLRLADPLFFAICRFCDLLTQICCGLATSANLQILYFSAYK